MVAMWLLSCPLVPQSLAINVLWECEISEHTPLGGYLVVADCNNLAHKLINDFFCFRGNLDKAIDMFNKAINLAKSEMEMAHLYSLCDAAYAQTEVARKYGLKPPTL